MKLKSAAMLLLTAVLGSAWTSAVRAEDWVANLFEAAPDDYIKTRAYVGGFGTSATIDGQGNFNGVRAVSSTTPFEFNLVSGINRNFGFGGLVGYRTGAYAVEISYWRSEHEAYWSGGGPVTAFSTANLQSINFDLKRYFLTKFPTQPFFSLGIGFPWLVAHEASTRDYVEYVDYTLSGVGLNLGIGMEVYLGSNFSIFGSAVQRWSGFSQGLGARKESHDIVDAGTGEKISYQGDGLNFYIGGTVGF